MMSLKNDDERMAIMFRLEEIRRIIEPLITEEQNLRNRLGVLEFYRAARVGNRAARVDPYDIFNDT